MKTLNQDIKTQNFKRVYLLYSEDSKHKDERYLRNLYRDRLIKAMLPEGDTMNLSRYEGKDIDVTALLRTADTFPFFADRRVILIEGSAFFSEKAPEALADYMTQIPETTCIIFNEAKTDKRSKLYKAIAKNGYAAQLTRPDERQLLIWLAQMVKKEGKQIRESTLRYFLGLVDNDMSSLLSEMEKLICYTGTRPVIENADVDAVCSVYIENRIFDMMAAIAGRDSQRALRLYSDLLALKEPPIKLLVMIGRQFSELYQVKELAMTGMPIKTISERTGIRDFVVKRDYPLAERFTPEALRQAIADCAAYDEAVKSGRLGDQMAVELLISSCGLR